MNSIITLILFRKMMVLIKFWLFLVKTLKIARGILFTKVHFNQSEQSYGFFIKRKLIIPCAFCLNICMPYVSLFEKSVQKHGHSILHPFIYRCDIQKISNNPPPPPPPSRLNLTQGDNYCSKIIWGE